MNPNIPIIVQFKVQPEAALIRLDRAALQRPRSPTVRRNHARPGLLVKRATEQSWDLLAVANGPLEAENVAVDAVATARAHHAAGVCLCGVEEEASKIRVLLDSSFVRCGGTKGGDFGDDNVCALDAALEMVEGHWLEGRWVGAKVATDGKLDGHLNA